MVCTVQITPPRALTSLPTLLQLASGEVFGDDQPISLLMLGSDRSREALEGVAMELEDSLFPLLREVRSGSSASLLAVAHVLLVAPAGLRASKTRNGAPQPRRLRGGSLDVLAGRRTCLSASIAC